jgi:hypothetical protein
MRNKLWGFVVPAVASITAAASTGAQAQEPAVATQKTGGEAIGATVVHPAAWSVERESYTYEGTYGYTLWYPDTDAAHDHGGRVHLHTAFYRYPNTNPDGSPYRGAGLQVTRNHYVGTAARRKGIEANSHMYKYDKTSPKDAFCREDGRRGERYLVSN